VEREDGAWLQVPLEPMLTQNTGVVAGEFHLECIGPDTPYWVTSFVVWPTLKVHDVKGLAGNRSRGLALAPFAAQFGASAGALDRCLAAFPGFCFAVFRGSRSVLSLV